MQKLTKEQAAVISAYTGYCCGPFSDVQEYVEKILKRPVWTHEFADKRLMEEIQAAAKPDFLSICYEEKV